MLDINKHKFIIVQLLKDIYSDMELASLLGFKGGTALMLFYNLPRFSIDIDLNLLDEKKGDKLFDKLKAIVLKYGTIKDEAKKHFGILIVLNYGEKERNLKVEISNRMFNDRYEIKNFLGINMRVMSIEDMFAHKLCALLDRNMLTNRDIFDCYFLMKQRTPVNGDIVETRMGMKFTDYLDKCITVIGQIPEKSLLNGLGELMDSDLKTFVKNKLKAETMSLFNMYRELPIFSVKN